MTQHNEESLMALADEYNRCKGYGDRFERESREQLLLAIREVLAERDNLNATVDAVIAEQEKAIARAEKAEAELAVYKDAKKPPLEQSQSNCLAWMNRYLNAEAECERLRELIAELDGHEGAEGWSEGMRERIDAALKEQP